MRTVSSDTFFPLSLSLYINTNKQILYLYGHTHTRLSHKQIIRIYYINCANDYASCFTILHFSELRADQRRTEVDSFKQ